MQSDDDVCNRVLKAGARCSLKEHGGNMALWNERHTAEERSG